MSENKKFKILLEELKNHEAVKIGDIRIGWNGPRKLFVTGWTRYLNIKNINKEIAKKELNEIKNIFFEILAKSPDLANFFSDKKINFNLAYKSGQSSIGICSEFDDEIKWLVDFDWIQD